MNEPLYPGFPAYYYRNFRLTLTLIASHAGCDFYRSEDREIRLLMVWGPSSGWHENYTVQGWAGFSSSHRFSDSLVLWNGVLLPTPEALDFARGLLSLIE